MTMKFVKHAPSMQTPIAWEASGVARVGGTRVTLESVVFLHKAGESPSQIHEAFPTLELADIYAVIAYYLRNTEAVEAYLRRVEEGWKQLDAELDARYPDRHEHMARIRERYVAMQQGKQAS